MKTVLFTVLLTCFVFTAVVSAETKVPVVPKKKYENTKLAPVPAPASQPVKALSNTAVPAVKTTAAPVVSSKVSDKLPPLPAGQARVDVNVIQEEFFVCPKCDRESMKSGKCPLHGLPLEKKLRSFTYKCKICGFSSEKEDSCPMCKDHPKLKKFEVTYQDVGCKVVESAPGKCPKCKQDLKKISNVELKK